MEINVYNSNYGITPLKTTKIPGNQEIQHINIRPDEIAVVCKEIIDEKNIMTRVHLFQCEARIYQEVSLK